MSSKPYKDYKVNELKELLKGRDLSTSGTKPELIARLEESDASNGTGAEAEAETEPTGESVAETKAEEPKDANEAEQAAKPAAEASQEPAKTAPAPGAEKKETKPEEPVDRVKQLEQQIATEKAAGNMTEELEKRLKRLIRFGVAAVADAQAKATITSHRHFRRNHRNGRSRHSAGVTKK